MNLREWFGDLAKIVVVFLSIAFVLTAMGISVVWLLYAVDHYSILPPVKLK